MVFNAAKDCPTMIELLEKHTQQHYIYMKDSYPHLVPVLDNLFHESKYDLDENLNNCDTFFLKIFERLRNLVLVDKCSIQVQMSVLSNAISDLQKLAHLHSMLAPSCNFFSTYLQCQISLRKV